MSTIVTASHHLKKEWVSYQATGTHSAYKATTHIIVFPPKKLKKKLQKKATSYFSGSRWFLCFIRVSTDDFWVIGRSAGVKVCSMASTFILLCLSTLLKVFASCLLQKKSHVKELNQKTWGFSYVTQDTLLKHPQGRISRLYLFYKRTQQVG